MKNLEVIPAMDLMDGHCVRLRQGDFNQKKTYATDPVAVAKQFEDAGFRRLHIVDLDGARSGSPKHLSVLEKVATETSLIIDFSGGIKSDADIENVFAAGAVLSALGSVAVKNKSLFINLLRKFGPDKILLGVDVRNEKLALSGWIEQTDIDLLDFLGEMTLTGIQQVFCTDIGKDGLLAGPSTELYRKIRSRFPELALVASGGVHTPEDLTELENIGCTGAIVGRAIYEEMNDLKKWLR